MNGNTNSIAGAVARHGLTAGGVAGLVNAQDDILKFVSLLVTVIGLGWSIYEKLTRKPSGNPTNGVNLIPFAAGLLALCIGCASHPQTTVQVTADDAHNIGGSVDVVVSTNLNVGLTGSGNPDTGAWNIGLVITFKAAPEEAVRDYLLAAGFVPLATNAFALPGLVDTDLERAAVVYAELRGGELRGLSYAQASTPNSIANAHLDRVAKAKTGLKRTLRTVEPLDITLALAGADGQPVNLRLWRPAATPPIATNNLSVPTLDARGQAARDTVLRIVRLMAKNDPNQLRDQCNVYYACALVGHRTGNLTAQKISTALEDVAISWYLQSVVLAAPEADLTQVCLGIALAADQELRALGKPGVVSEKARRK